jgi:hypothetical protein
MKQTPQQPTRVATSEAIRSRALTNHDLEPIPRYLLLILTNPGLQQQWLRLWRLGDAMYHTWQKNIQIKTLKQQLHSRDFKTCTTQTLSPLS